MADRLTNRKKKQQPGHPVPHTTAISPDDVIAAGVRPYFFPEKGVSFKAADLTEATEQFEKETSKQESGDGR